MRFQRNISLLLDKMEARRCVVFTEGSGCTLRKGGMGSMSSGEPTAARLGEGSSVLRLAGPAAEHRDSDAGTRRAW
jgi:hypothetical protein